MEESILTSIKEALGIVPGYEVFDKTILLYINSAFFSLQQLGVHDKPFSIDSDETVWSDYSDNENIIEAVKPYIILKVKMVFDPPSTSFLLDAIDRQLKELEWRLNVEVDPKKST